MEFSNEVDEFLRSMNKLLVMMLMSGEKDRIEAQIILEKNPEDGTIRFRWNIKP